MRWGFGPVGVSDRHQPSGVTRVSAPEPWLAAISNVAGSVSKRNGATSTASIRARVIARTETAFATNVSIIEGAKAITGIEQMMVLDARKGNTDELCESLNGAVVTIDEARQLAEDEHPNGTRSFTPLTPQLVEELGL